MMAAVYRRFGPPEVVTAREVPSPRPRDDEILVRVRAATVGVVDSLARRGAPWYARVSFGLRRPRFRVLGSDFAGQVAAAGPAVTRFAVGDAVFGTTAPRFGAHAGYLCLPEHAEASALTAVIEACYPLERIADAHRRVDAGHKKGNVIVTMAEPQDRG